MIIIFLFKQKKISVWGIFCYQGLRSLTLIMTLTHLESMIVAILIWGEGIQQVPWFAIPFPRISKICHAFDC